MPWLTFNSANETVKSSWAQSIDVSIAIGEVVLNCGSRGGSAYVAPTKDFRIHVFGDWVAPIAPLTPKAKRQEENVHPDRPGLVTCNPMSLCFEARDHLLRDCLIGAADDRSALVQCYRGHSNGLAEYCRCSDHDGGHGYPVQSVADKCFIDCRVSFFQCQESDARGRCESPYSTCMNTCLQPTFDIDPQEQLPNCDSTTTCFRNCDFGLRNCLLNTGLNVAEATQCWTHHTTCAARDCQCDDTTDQDGYPILSDAGICMKWAYYGLTQCKVGPCDADFATTLQNCLPQQEFAHRLISRDSLTLTYASEPNGNGKKLDIVVENDVCQTIAWTMVGNWVSVVMPGGSYCRFHAVADCWESYDYCEAASNLAVFSCNLGWTAHQANSVRCWW